MSVSRASNPKWKNDFHKNDGGPKPNPTPAPPCVCGCSWLAHGTRELKGCHASLFQQITESGCSCHDCSGYRPRRS